MKSAVFVFIVFGVFASRQSGGDLGQELGKLVSQYNSKSGFIDFSGDLAKPGVAVVFGTMSKFSQGQRERMADGEGDLGGGLGKLIKAGTVFYKIPCTGEIAIADAFYGEVKGKSVNVAFDLQLAKVMDGSESRAILTDPRRPFETPFTALWVLEKEKGKKTFRATRIEKFEIKNEKGADPAAAIRKRAGDHYGINRRKADFEAILAAANEAHDAKEKIKIAARLQKMLDEKPKWQLVETDALANHELGAYERRAKEFIKENAAAAESRPGEKPPR